MGTGWEAKKTHLRGNALKPHPTPTPHSIFKVRISQAPI